MHRFVFLIVAAAVALSVAPTAQGADPEVLVLSSSEDAGGTTQADFDLPVLKMLERRTVQQLEAKMTSYLKAQGQSAQIPKLEAQSHYVEAKGTKLAVVRVRSPKAVNQVFIYGIKGNSFLRVVCARTKNFEESVPLFHGACADKLREVFGVSISQR